MDVSLRQKRIIFDPIYGFILLTPVEWEIIHTPFYQRLRWIKQLGFSFYVFPGAEHSRFGHSIGCMYNAHQILHSIGKGVSDQDLVSQSVSSKEKKFHQSIRLGALMHDLGTFPFSHTTEDAYIKFGESSKSNILDDHENLGSFIIKNTKFPGGISYILEKNGYDPQHISDLIKGASPSILANQILHSEVDCDRMDYLLRDAHYTGLEYGTYDREYLLHHFETKEIDKKEILTINKNAIHSIEDFLMARFSWYSQVTRSSRGRKYDAIAEKICFHLLEKKYLYRYSDLLEMITNNPMGFLGFNDNYFLGKIQEHLAKGSLKESPKIEDMAVCLLLEKGVKTIQHPDLKSQLLNQDDQEKYNKVRKKAEEKVSEIRSFLKVNGGPKDWVLEDVCSRDISFVRSYKKIIKNLKTTNVLLERDPVKVSYDNGEVKLLAEVDNSVISILQNTNNYIPNLFCSHSAFEILLKANLVEE
jgi:uncharacterized protein